MAKATRSMTEGALLPHIILYTIPIILTSILQLLFNAADLIIVGRYCGSISVAAVGATGAVSNLIINLFIGLSVGAGVCVAHGLGAKKSKSVHRTVHTAVSAALAGGALLTVIGILLAEPLLVLMNTPKDVLPLSATYMKIYFAGMTFTMLYNFCASILRAAGDTKSPLIYLTLSGIINVILNVIFVTLFNMNVAGVALATAISQALSAILVTVALMRRNDECRLHPKELRFYKKELLKLIRIGVPASIQGSLFSISNVIIQSSVNSFGPVVMSGNAASANIEGFVYVILNAFHQTTVNFVGQNTGAEKYKRVKKTVAICLVSVALTGIIAGLGVYLLREPLLSIYITDSAKALYYGMIRISYICIPYFLCGLMDVSTGALRGMGSSLAPMIISVLGVCGFRIAWILTIFQIERFHTPQCLYASYTFSWTLTFLIQIIAFVFVYRRYIRSNAN